MAEETLGQCVRRLILQKSLDDHIKYDDVDIARRAGISSPVMSRIVNDEPGYNPTKDTVLKLTAVLGTEVAAKWLDMHRELVELWQVQDTPAGKAAINQAHDYYKQASNGNQGPAVYVNARS